VITKGQIKIVLLKLVITKGQIIKNNALNLVITKAKIFKTMALKL